MLKRENLVKFMQSIPQRVICVVGTRRRVGKTTVVEGLIKGLTERGYDIATIKHIAHGTFETDENFPKKDTTRHFEAGANFVMAVTNDKIISIFRDESPSLESALKKLDDKYDLVIVEGFKDSRFPKIAVVSEEKELSRFLDNDEIVLVTGPIATKTDIYLKDLFKSHIIEIVKLDEINKMVDIVENHFLSKIVELLPNKNCGYCGYENCDVLAKAILKGQGNINQCLELFPEVYLEVNGDIIYIKAFVQKIIKEAILGMVSTLRQIPEEIDQINIKIR